MKLRRWICFLLCLVLTVCLCAPALASQKAVNLILKGSPALAVEQVIKTALRML